MSVIERPVLENYTKPLQDIGNVHIYKGNKVNSLTAQAAIKRINTFVDWNLENSKILDILHTKPKHCYFAMQNGEVQGYAIVREQGNDQNDLHVSWIATDILGKGIGSQLMFKIIEKSKKLGNRTLTLNHLKNDKLTQFYKKIADSVGARYIQENDKNPLHFHITYVM